MGLWSTTSNFTKGELDPLLVGRTDLQAYYQGVEEATNVQCLPQGGLRKRNGIRYIDSLTIDSIFSSSNPHPRFEVFKFNVDTQYLIVFTLRASGFLTVVFYRDGQLITNINASGNDYLDIPILVGAGGQRLIDNLDFIQSANTIIITDERIAPVRIVRGSADNLWSTNPLPLTNIPQFDYNDASSPTPVSEIQRIDFNTNWLTGDTFKVGLEGILTDEITYNIPDYDDTAQQIQDALQRLPNTGSTGVTAVVFSSPDGQIDVTFAGASARDWPLVTIQPVNGVDIEDNAAVVSRLQAGTARAEDVWSTTRGWPRTCTFHENRLWFGGSQSRPSTIWGSTSLDPFDFDSGRGRDDEGIDATLATDQINTINGIISNRALQIFTSGAEFYVPESPITPSNFSAVPQTNLGTKRVRPVVLEGSTHFIQQTGKAIFEFQFINEFQANEARSVSILAPHLINNPIQMTVRRGSSVNDANYLYLASDESELTVFNSNKIEGVQGFTRFSNQKGYQSVAVVDELLYVCSENTTDSGDLVFFIGVEDPDLNTDWAVKANTGGSGVLTGLDHLEGETVKVIADGTVREDAVVTGGQITVEDQDLNGQIAVLSANVVEAGLEYKPTIRTMPFNVNLNDGPHVAQKKRIMRCGIQYDNSIGIRINGEFLPSRTIGVNQFDAPQPQTGLDRIFLHGWSLTAQVEITQEEPYDMTILALNLEVKV